MFALADQQKSFLQAGNRRSGSRTVKTPTGVGRNKYLSLPRTRSSPTANFPPGQARAKGPAPVSTSHGENPIPKIF